MDNRERKIFWDTLCSLKGEDLEADIQKLEKTIKYPSHLYRYRPMSLNSVQALQENKLYFSTSDYCDDPFDTFIDVQIPRIKEEFDMIKKMGKENFEYVAQPILKMLDLNNNQTDEITSQIVDIVYKIINNQQICAEIRRYFRNIRNEIKKETISACFSERPYNESLWIKYAQQHQGFVVEYDILNMLKKPLYIYYGKCENYSMKTNNIISLYPMYYSEENYDATKYAQFLSLQKIGSLDLFPKNYDKVIKKLGNQIWEREKITLIKKICHSYDQEWRMLVNRTVRMPVYIEWIPSAIYLGLNMTDKDAEFVTKIAKTSGIRKVYKCCISDEGSLIAEEI